ncbi:radical SAM protein [Kitasatospora sp. NBC_00240]|uniref:4Fe-4S single cluster domain-containing protein n=1 Tax=Kitasatospora sp. NBC_00240 TaxID=2903567 RepID=UPI0022569EE7|nr:4Fe-4S single cluster domain-containing protein [Kitasatospora sp. NBC_00240]MCX5208765.1 radical SAM protein [Kitasatospora sp. NBC_00240]
MTASNASPRPVELMLNKAHYPVTSLGPGTRAGIWTQGCTIGCAGCVSQDTWTADPGTLVDIAALRSWLAGLPDPLDGITVSGGEPFQQPEALAALLEWVHVWRRGRPAPLDVLVYSGYSLDRLRREHSALLDRCDAVITGPYIDRLNSPGLRWSGSSNQRLTALTDLGRERYEGAGPVDAPPMQVAVDDGRVWFIGVPRRGDMERLSTRLRSAGITMEEVSWRS